MSAAFFIVYCIYPKNTTDKKLNQAIAIRITTMSIGKPKSKSNMVFTHELVRRMVEYCRKQFKPLDSLSPNDLLAIPSLKDQYRSP